MKKLLKRLFSGWHLICGWHLSHQWTLDEKDVKGKIRDWRGRIEGYDWFTNWRCTRCGRMERRRDFQHE
jgi:hypothetical protein